MERLIKVLIDLLVSKGMELTSIPAFIRNLANALASDPYMTLDELNTQIQLLGWDDFEMDLCTLQIVLATFDSESSVRVAGRDLGARMAMELQGFAGGKEESVTYRIDPSKFVHS